jgi:hypothetical protein
MIREPFAKDPGAMLTQADLVALVDDFFRIAESGTEAEKQAALDFAMTFGHRERAEILRQMGVDS